MSAADFLDDTYPHGTVDGFRGGCRTNRLCATAESWLSCVQVHTRYAGDVVFRRRVDAGLTVAELAALDVSEAAAKAQAEKDANRRLRVAVQAERKREVKRKRSTYGKSSNPAPVPYTAEEVTRIRELNAAGMTDTQIAKALGRPFGSVTSKRSALGLPRNKPKKAAVSHGTYAGYCAGCRDNCPAPTSCHAAAKEYWRISSDKSRRNGGIPPAYTEADRARVRALYAELGNRTEVARRLGLGRKLVGRIVRVA